MRSPGAVQSYRLLITELRGADCGRTARRESPYGTEANLPRPGTCYTFQGTAHGGQVTHRPRSPGRNVQTQMAVIQEVPALPSGGPFEPGAPEAQLTHLQAPAARSPPSTGGPPRRTARSGTARCPGSSGRQGRPRRRERVAALRGRGRRRRARRPRRGPRRPARRPGARWRHPPAPAPVGPACPRRPLAPGPAAARPSPAACCPRFCRSASSGCCPWLPPARRPLWEVDAGSEGLHHQEKLPRMPRGCPARRRARRGGRAGTAPRGRPSRRACAQRVYRGGSALPSPRLPQLRTEADLEPNSLNAEELVTWTLAFQNHSLHQSIMCRGRSYKIGTFPLFTIHDWMNGVTKTWIQ